jgi:hypothetical protein
MTHERDGLLAQIEAGVLDDRTPRPSLLQKFVVLGGQAGSTKMRGSDDGRHRGLGSGR